MIFDSAKAELVYHAATNGYPERAVEFHTLCGPLIESIAASVSGVRYADLVQDGHLKVQLVLNARSYDPAKGRMYSFLSRILRNYMLDILRAEHRNPIVCELLDGANCVEIAEPLPHKDWDCVIAYIRRRFPSIESSAMCGISEYMIDAVTESCAGMSRGIVRTLCNTYLLHRHVANVLYSTTAAVCRMEVMGHAWKPNVPSALSLVCSRQLELSLMPEMVLYMGDEGMANIRRVFEGSYVKF